MAIEFDDLLDAFKVNSPLGMEMPRDIDTGAIHEATIQRWAEDAAGQICQRRGRTTRMETTITTSADVQEYDLPANCREVLKIDRDRSAVDLDIPTHNQPILGPRSFGVLPTGQEITASLDLIGRQRISRLKREDEFELVAGQIRFLFPVDDDEEILVTYRATDRDLASIPDDHFTLVLKYLQLQNLDFVINKFGAQTFQNNDRFDESTMAVYFRRRAELNAEWIAGLDSIGPEADE